MWLLVVAWETARPPGATVSTHWLNCMRVANGLIYVDDREADGNGNPSGEMVCQNF